MRCQRRSTRKFSGVFYRFVLSSSFTNSAEQRNVELRQSPTSNDIKYMLSPKGPHVVNGIDISKCLYGGLANFGQDFILDHEVSFNLEKYRRVLFLQSHHSEAEVNVDLKKLQFFFAIWISFAYYIFHLAFRKLSCVEAARDRRRRRWTTKASRIEHDVSEL